MIRVTKLRQSSRWHTERLLLTLSLFDYNREDSPLQIWPVLITKLAAKSGAGSPDRQTPSMLL